MQQYHQDDQSDNIEKDLPVSGQSTQDDQDEEDQCKDFEWFSNLVGHAWEHSGQENTDGKRDSQDDKHREENIHGAQTHFLEDRCGIRVETAPESQVQGCHDDGRQGRNGSHTDGDGRVPFGEIGHQIRQISSRACRHKDHPQRD